MNIAVLLKIKQNVKKHGDIKLITTEARRNYLVSDPNYYTTKTFSRNLLAKEMKKKPTIIHQKTSIFKSINIRNK